MKANIIIENELTIIPETEKIYTRTKSSFKNQIKKFNEIIFSGCFTDNQINRYGNILNDFGFDFKETIECRKLENKKHYYKLKFVKPTN